MKHKKKLWLLIVFALLLMSSCVKEQLASPKQQVDEVAEKPIFPLTRSGSTRSQFVTMPNPYAINVMQKVYDTYSSAGITLEPTDLYIKFMPKDSAQLNALERYYGLELFDHPLDIDLQEGDIYINDSIPEGTLAWLYTTVKPDFEFPKQIPYEIIQECYIPKDDETVEFSAKGETITISVEKEAFRLLGYTIDNDDSSIKGSGSNPQGTITVLDNTTGEYVPLKGAKVRCHRFVKWGSAFTDEHGYYRLDKSFKYKPHYAVVFENSKGFNIYGQYATIVRANYNMGWHSSEGYSDNIEAGCRAWPWAVVNNAAYEYYDICKQAKILTPPDKLKIWVLKNAKVSSAPMLNKVYNQIGYNSNIDAHDFLINIGYGFLASTFNILLKAFLPDITIGTDDKGYDKIYQTVCHELSHASHYSQVKGNFWAKYISYIMTYGAYGDGSGKNAELCGIGEMWGYAMGQIHMFEKYNKEYEVSFLSPISGWIEAYVFWELYWQGILTIKEIYDCLQPSVDTYKELIDLMCLNYPERKNKIQELFFNRGFDCDYDIVDCDKAETIVLGRPFNITWKHYEDSHTPSEIEFQFIEEEHFDGVDSRNISIVKSDTSRADITIKDYGHYIIEGRVKGTNITKRFHVAHYYRPGYTLADPLELGEALRPGIKKIDKLGEPTGDTLYYDVTFDDTSNRIVAAIQTNYCQITTVDIYPVNNRRIDRSFGYTSSELFTVDAGSIATIELPPLERYRFSEVVYDDGTHIPLIEIEPEKPGVNDSHTYTTVSSGYYTLSYPEDFTGWEQE